MSEAETTQTIDQPRNDAGQFVSPPPVSAESPAAPSDVTPSVLSEASTEAAPTVDRDKIEREAYDAMKGKREATSEVRTDSPRTETAPEPVETPAGGNPQQIQGAGAASVANVAAPAAKAAPADPREAVKASDYGLNEQAFNDLKRVKMLTPPEYWKSMDVEQQADIIRTARNLRSQQDRVFQQSQQAAQQQNQNTQTNFTPPAGQMPAGTQTNPAGQGRDFGTPTVGQTSSAAVAQTTPAQAQQPVAAATGQLSPGTLSADIEAQLASAAETFGQDYADLQRRGFEQIAQQQQAVQQLAQQQTQLLQSLASQRQQEQMQMVAASEARALAKLSKDFPQLADPAKAAGVIADARAFAGAMSAQGRAYPSLDAFVDASVEFAARANFFPEIQTQERKKLAERRTQSLAGSVERGTAAVESGRSTGPRDIEKEAYDAIQALSAQGIRGDAAVSEVRQRLNR